MPLPGARVSAARSIARMQRYDLFPARKDKISSEAKIGNLIVLSN